MSQLKLIITGSFLLAALVLCELACSSNGFAEPTPYPPDQFGTYSVGLREFDFYDSQRQRSVFTKVWYPAKKPPRSADPFFYLELLEGQAYQDLELDKSGAPYPLVLFSHGNQGLGMQSFSLTEHLASHGFVVVAPNHEGNTIFDNPSDEEVAQISLDRPLDIVYAMEQIISMNAQSENDFHAVIDLEAIGISGHSFGGYTTILLAGADVDVSAAQDRCDAGIPGDIFCPYLVYWDSEENVKRPEGAAVF
ncbi:MAG: hypothetical protein JRJ87_19210, partial [Deltaproteobacteria bacterium]|nr:hypothetical protein [Deltaproteobacteria bacterium]